MRYAMIVSITILCCVASASGGAKESLEKSKIQSASTGKPILLEFMREDCEFCELASREAETDPSVRAALRSVVHQLVNVLDTEGKELAKEYHVGTTYPVFVLTDSKGDVITRWTGYTGRAKAFVSTLQNALNDKRTINERMAQFEEKPSYADAVNLARFLSAVDEHAEAIEYLKKAAALNSRMTFSYDIFNNAANAVWKEQEPYEFVFGPAFAVLKAGDSKPTERANVSRLMCRISRKFDRTDSLAILIKAGLDATAEASTQDMRDANSLLRSEFALQIDADTAKAIAIEKERMGTGWESDRDVSFAFAKWCLERRVNLDEAEAIASRTVDLVYPGVYRARVLSTLGDILEAQGKTTEAMAKVVLAIEQNPDDPYYMNQLKRLRGDIE
jgi:thioredoxin-related protein